MNHPDDRHATGTPFLDAYEGLLQTFGTDYATVNHRRISAAVLAGADGYVRPTYAKDELHLSPAGYAALNAALAPLLAAQGRE